MVVRELRALCVRVYVRVCEAASAARQSKEVQNNRNHGDCKMLTLFGLLCLMVAGLSFTCARFRFEFVLQDVETRTTNCDAFTPCDTYLSMFCLRGRRSTSSTDTNDCPLGRIGRIDASPLRPPQRRSISQDEPWPGEFQMYVRALDEDGGLNGADDHLDNIFINLPLQVNTEFTPPRTFNGQRNQVSIEMRFRVTCWENYYGANCTVLCVPPNSSYACDINGILQCQHNCKNPTNPCETVPSPCANNGNCIPSGQSDYICECTPGFTGSRCDQRIIDNENCGPSSERCPNNSTCHIKMESGQYGCVCDQGFDREDDECVLIPLISTSEIPAPMSTTFEPGTEVPLDQTTTLDLTREPSRSRVAPGTVGAVVAVLVILVFLCVLILVFAVVLVKRRQSRKYDLYSGDPKVIAKPLDNPVYDLNQPMLPSKPPNDLDYATPTSSNAGATIRTVDNILYGNNQASMADNYEDIRYVQNPVYGDTTGGDDGTGESEMYSSNPESDTLTDKQMHIAETGQEEDGVRKEASGTGRSCVYAVVDKTKKKKRKMPIQPPTSAADFGSSRASYEQLQPEDQVRLSDIRGSGYEALQH